MNSYPKNIQIASKFGTLNLAVTDGEHVYVNNAGDFIVRGVFYQIGFHFYRRPTGEFLPAANKYNPDSYDRSQCYISRRGSNSDVSEPARRSITEELVKVVDTWAKLEYANGTAFWYGHLHNVRQQTERNNGKIADLEKEIAKLRAENAALLQLPAPPDNTQKDVDLSTFEAYRDFFAGEYLRATGEQYRAGDEPIRAFFDTHYQVRVAVKEQIGRESEESAAFNAGLKAAEDGILRDANPYSGTARLNLRDSWDEGWAMKETLDAMRKQRA